MNEQNKNFIVYTSSAGSGKTYTLSRFFIKLLLNSKDTSYFRTIAAITFTNKAANEMKERIFNNLILLSLTEYSSEVEEKASKDLLSDYSKNFNIPIPEIQEKSKAIVVEILHNYSDLTVQTIDKFTHKIIRPFAKDLDLSPDFSIELNEDDLINKSVELLLQKSSNDELLSKILLDFAYHKVEQGKRFQSFEKDVIELASVFKKEDAISYLKDFKDHELSFFFDKKNELKQKVDYLSNEIANCGLKALNLINSNNIEINDFYQGAKGVGTFFSKASKKDLPLIANSYIIKALNENIWSKINAPNEEIINSISNDLSILLSHIIQLTEKYNNFFFLYQRIFPTALLNEIEGIISEVKTNQNILSISDFNKLISNLIFTSHLSVPFLYERIGERYNHYLIDEFQDTSVLQWNNMLPLVDDALAKGKENLVVGDPKQAIYRFRNGDVEQFVKLPKLPHKPNYNYDFFEKSLHRNIQKESLNTNYRSYTNIIKFNNELFGSLVHGFIPYHQTIYKDVVQNFTNKVGGYVKLGISDPEDFDSKAINFTLDSIKSAIDSGFNLNDISVLVRNRKEINKIAEYLIQNNIEVVSEESLKLTYSKDVAKIIDSISFFNNTGDELQFTKLIFNLNPNIESGVLRSVIEKKEFESFLQKEYSLKSDILQLPLILLIDTLIEKLNVNAIDTYVQQFKSYVWDKYKSEGFSASDFVKHWKHLEETNAIPSLKNVGVKDAVQILTIHKSKGLQYPVVIIPFLNWNTDYRKSIKWIKPSGISELENLAVSISPKTLENTPYKEISEKESEEAFLESINILYVALTRAEEQLFLFTDGKGIGKYIIDNAPFELVDFYELGNPIRVSPKKEHKPSNSFELSTCQANKNLFLNIAPESDKYWERTTLSEKEYGTYFHDILKGIINKGDKSKAFRKIDNDDNLTEHEKQFMKEEIENMFRNEVISSIFSSDNNIFNEKEIYYEGELYRIDKLSLTKGNKAYILDYKTGEQKSEDLKQLSKYSEVVNSLSIFDLESYLFYTKTSELIKL